MSWLDKIGSTVFPLASDEKRAEARRKAEELARSHPWLAQIVAHHKAIEQCFADALSATDADSRRRAMKQLAQLNTGHSIAEEVTIYPALVEYNGAIGGKLMMLGGAAITLSALLSLPRDARVAVMGGSVALMVIPPFAYSWWLWHRKMNTSA